VALIHLAEGEQSLEFEEGRGLGEIYEERKWRLYNR
jgi:hypothetical protein